MSSTTDIMRKNLEAPAALLANLRNKALFVALVAGVATVIGAFVSPEHFFRGYLIGFMWILGLSLGCMAWLMTGHLSGGNWWMLGRRIFEAGVRTLPLVAVLFIPVLLGMNHLYGWMHIDPAKDHVFAEKTWWLNPTFFIIRAVIYFVVWIGLGFLLTRGSWKQDESADPAIWQRLKAIAGPGILLYGLTITFAAIDWVMSLDAHWYSSIYGMIFIAGQALSVLALTIFMLAELSGYEPMSEVLMADRLHDYGKLMLALVMVWAYFSFSQLLITWMGNLPEEISWYLHRFKNGWGVVSLGIAAFHFALPFVLLLSRDLKRSARSLVPVALFVIFMRVVDIYWLVIPNPTAGVEAPHFTLHWTYITAPLALGGIWMATFVTYLGKRPLLVRNEPMLPRLWEKSHGH